MSTHERRLSVFTLHKHMGHEFYCVLATPTFELNCAFDGCYPYMILMDAWFYTLQEFQEKAICKLWSYTQHSNGTVGSAAYKALANFSYDTIKYSYLPEHVCVEHIGNVLATRNSLAVVLTMSMNIVIVSTMCMSLVFILTMCIGVAVFLTTRISLGVIFPMCMSLVVILAI